MVTKEFVEQFKKQNPYKFDANFPGMTVEQAFEKLNSLPPTPVATTAVPVEIISSKVIEPTFVKVEPELPKKKKNANPKSVPSKHSEDKAKV